jgi:hypothetical protein
LLPQQNNKRGGPRPPRFSACMAGNHGQGNFSFFPAHYLLFLSSGFFCFVHAVKIPQSSINGFEEFHSNLGILEIIEIGVPLAKKRTMIGEQSITTTGEPKSVPISPVENYPTNSLTPNSIYSDVELFEMLFSEPPVDPPLKNKISWTPSYTISTGLGFSDNPLNGPFIKEEASFWENSLESFFLIESRPEFFTYLYFYGEGKIYEELPEHNTNSTYLGQFEHAYNPTGSTQTYGFRARHTYYNQAFDFSDLALPFSMSVTSNKSEVIPFLSKEISASTTATLEILMALEDFKSSSDDNQDVGISLIFKGSPSLLDWKFQSDYVEKHYKDRLRRDWDGMVEEGKLKTKKVNLAVTLEKDLDRKPLKNSKVKLSWSNLQDDGGGYYDYEKLSLSLREEFIISSYWIEFSLGGAQTKYDRRVTDTGERFTRDSLTSGLSITNRISENLEGYFKWSREEDFSSARDYEYSSNFWSMGVTWEISP